MRFEVLGPLRVGAGSVVVPARQQRVLLATLLLNAGEVVPAERLIEAVWSDRPPRSATSQLHSAVYRLRKLLAPAGSAELITTEPGGYQIRIDPHGLDLWQFRQLRDAARAAAEPEAAAGQYRAALRLWRGPALVGIDSPEVRGVAAALDEERLQAQQECIEVELTLGKAGELIAELTALAQEHPYREGLHGTLMRALHQAGRQADALAAYRQLRHLLHDELGTEPAPELQQLHQAILNRDLQLTAPTPAPASAVTPRELPTDVAGFTGRATALKTLDGMLSQQAGPVVITAIAGTAGVGKTALAVHWAHRVADRFPDGQLYLNLRGYATDAPSRPIEALAAMLRSLGVAPEQIPADEAQAAAMYRTRLADKRVLVVLDNAGTVGQVRPLLPGSPGCLVLITSRDRLAGLVARDGAYRLTLDVLTADESKTLLTRLLGAERVAAEASAAAELAQTCAHLPLALRIAAADLTARPSLSITAYVSELSRDGLNALRIEGDEQGALQATFDLSYRRLPADAARLFRLLGLVPGTDFTAPAAAALADTTEGHTRQLLAKLTSAHLVEQHQPGRYTFHDLLRLYARERGEWDNDRTARQEVLYRLLNWYACGTNEAAETLYKGTLRLPVDPLEVRHQGMVGSQAEALAWLDAERANLVATIQHAADHGPRRFAWLLADRLRRYFWVTRHPVDGLRAAIAGLSAAEHENDLPAQAITNMGVGDALHATGRYAAAIERYSAAGDLADRAGWIDAKGAALLNLGTTNTLLGRFQPARVHLTQALELFRRTRQREREMWVLSSLGHLFRQMGQLQHNADYCAEQVAVYRDLDSGGVHSLARALANLGAAELDLGRLDQASEHLSTALALHRDRGDRWGELNVVDELANARLAAGRLDDALELARDAVTMARELGEPRVEALASSTLGAVYHQQGRVESAVEYHTRSIEMARNTRSPDIEMKALIGLAAARLRLHQDEDASGCVLQALETASKVGYRVHEGDALVVLAEIRLTQGQYAEARDYARRALDIHRETGHRLGGARALTALGSALHQLGDTQARQYGEAARKLFNEIGAPVPDELSATEGAGPGRKGVPGQLGS